MKKMAVTALLACLMLLMPAALAQEWAPEGVDMGGSRTPLPMPAGVLLSDVYPEFIPSLPPGYYLNDAEYDGQAFILLYRDTKEGGQEILMSVVQEEINPHALRYVEGSFEASGEKFLYLMLINGRTLHGSLYLFSLEDRRVNLVLEEPCSSNMALFVNPPEDVKGLGWVLWQNYILPIRLSDASSYEGMAASIEDLGGLPAIFGSFFFDETAEGQSKYSYLTPLEDHLLQLTTVLLSDETGGFISESQAVYDCLTRQLIKP